MSRRYGRATDHGQRYAWGVPFARELDSDEQASLERMLETATWHRVGTNRDVPISPDHVDVTGEYAYAEFTLALSGADVSPIDGFRTLSQAVGNWHAEYAPAATETKQTGPLRTTMHSPILALEAARAALTESLAADHADPEAADPGIEKVYALVATPERQLTDDEVAMFERMDNLLRDGSLPGSRLTQNAVGLDASPAGVVFYSDDGNVTPDEVDTFWRRLLRTVPRYCHADSTDEFLERRFYTDREQFTVYPSALDEARDTLQQRAEQRGPVNEADEGDSEVSA